MKFSNMRIQLLQLAIFFQIFLSGHVYAEFNTEADSVIDQTIQSDITKFDLHCVRKERLPDLELGVSGENSRTDLFQHLKYNKEEYTISTQKEDKIIRVKILKDSELLAHYLVPFQFNFDTSMDLLQFNMLEDEKISFLKMISCRVSPRIFHFRHSTDDSILFGVHTEIKYFSLNATEWFNEMMEQNPDSPRLITRDTNILAPEQSYNDPEYLNSEAQRPSTMVVTHKNPTDYKLSPGGWILFSFEDQSSNTIIMSGGFLNMCMSNSMVQIAAAFLSSNKDEINIQLSSLNSYVQNWGMTNALTLPIPNGAFPLWLLEQSQPEAYEKLFLGMKQYLEIMTKHRMEVVIGNSIPKTQKPIFRITLLPY